MKPYEYLPHTADVQFRAYGKTLEEAFCHAAYAFTDIITDHSKVKPLVEKQFTVSAENNEALLYDYLEYFVFFLDIDGFLLHEITSINLQNTHIHVVCQGDTQPEKYEVKAHIKAVTYQQMKVEYKKNQWCLQVIVDV